ncbi:hypothetical protein Golax_002830, partial [Gossypium laxum]|nr:hypothetical protein [Gossypium laxum]
MRWGVACGRKQLVATVLLLFVLSGPVKAINYLARAIGLVGYVLTTSFLIRENILALITINIHASLSYIFAAVGINLIPSMNFIYTLFGILCLLCVLAAPLVFIVPYKNGNENFIEIAKMVQESYIM